MCMCGVYRGDVCVLCVCVACIRGDACGCVNVCVAVCIRDAVCAVCGVYV